FDDEYEVRAFGDNFQAAGTSTILIEAGGYPHDPEKQYLRKIVFMAILKGLTSIASGTFKEKSTEEYLRIPENKLLHFEYILRNAELYFTQSPYRVDIGISLKEKLDETQRSTSRSYLIEDIGDLSGRFAYHDIDCTDIKLIPTRKLEVEEPAGLI